MTLANSSPYQHREEVKIKGHIENVHDTEK